MIILIFLKKWGLSHHGKSIAMSIKASRGFTLIELLVAISVMALMAILSWRGLDGISRAQAHMQQQSNDVLAIRATLAQWGTDLDAMTAQPDIPSLDWDGRVMRIMRRGGPSLGDGLRVVAWTRRTVDGVGYWFRWQSPDLFSRAAIELAWQKAQGWGQSPSDDDRLREVRTVALQEWQIFYYRGNAWSNPLSSAGSAGVVADAPAVAASSAASAAKEQAALPKGVRLVLTLSPGQALEGTLTRDWVRELVVGGQ
jgi:general secretion pathway protein J